MFNATKYLLGDCISLTMMVKSDSVRAIILRTMEFSLKETTVFRADWTRKKGPIYPTLSASY